MAPEQVPSLPPQEQTIAFGDLTASFQDWPRKLRGHLPPPPLRVLMDPSIKEDLFRVKPSLPFRMTGMCSCWRHFPYLCREMSPPAFPPFSPQELRAFCGGEVDPERPFFFLEKESPSLWGFFSFSAGRGRRANFSPFSSRIRCPPPRSSP